MAAIGLDPAEFASAFPFHLVLDREMRVVQAGASLSRLCPDLAPGADAHAALRCRVPVGTFHAALVDANPHSLFLLEHAASRLLLRGSFQRREGEGLYVFLGSPWITESRELEERGLRFRDFALHDPAIDMLQVMQAGRQTIADSKRLAANLQAQGEQLRAANERLRAGEAEARKLAMIAARTDNAVVLTDSTGRIEWVNAGFTRITGWRLDEVAGRTPGSVLQGPGTDRRTVERIRARIARGEGFTEELLNYGRDGRSYLLAIEVQPMRGDDGVVTGFMAIERDITSERAARDRLEMQFDVSQVLLEGGAPGEALPRVLAAICARGGWEGGRAWCFGPEGTRVLAEWGAVDDASAGPGATLREVVASNEPAWTDGAVPRFALPVGVNGVAAAAIDLFGVHGGAPAGDLLRGLGAVANQVGLFLARCRAEEGMRQATRAAERAAEARSQFVATVSHEIRTPLNAVIGMASLLALDELAPWQRERLGVIQVASEQLLSILNDVLDLSRMDAGAIEQRHADFCLRDLLDHAMGVARGLPAAGVLELSLEVADGLPDWLRGDQPRLAQVLINLLGNAVKFTARGRVVLRVEPARGARGERLVSFAVRDTGPGIAPEFHDRIFEPFGQAEGGAARKGTGLGLAISRRIAQALGGALLVASEPGRGSTFTLLLPLEPGVPQAPPRASVPAAAEARRLRILVAEDTPASQLVIRAILERLGHSIRLAADGIEAVRAAGEEAFDVVMLDVQMPGMDGYEAARAIRASLPGYGETPIIGLSALAQRADLARGLDSGMSHYVAKPVRFDDIATLLGRVCPEASRAVRR
jgi:PAS domain S-box-containing protein